MLLKAYRIGQSIVAAPDSQNALLVAARYVGAGKWLLQDVHELTDEEILQPVIVGSSVTVSDALNGLMAQDEPSSWSVSTFGQGSLIRWHRLLT